MKTLYIADDGTQFENKWKCADYEWKLAHPHLSEIRFLNAAGELLLSDPLEETTYNNTETVIVPNEAALQDLQELADYTGFCEYSDIDSIGTWKHNGKSMYKSGFHKEISEDKKMTREEEAIRGLKVLRKDFSGYKPNEEMFDMAIEALEQKLKKGYWIRQKGILGEEVNTYECSLCGRTIYCYEEDELEDYPYCHCGAKMVESEE